MPADAGIYPLVVLTVQKGGYTMCGKVVIVLDLRLGLTPRKCEQDELPGCATSLRISCEKSNAPL